MRCTRLVEAGALACRPAAPPGEKAGAVQHAVPRRRADGDDVGVQHHEREPPVALEWKALVVLDDRPLLPVFEPVVARDLAVVLVRLPVALTPGVVLALGHADPGDEAPGRQLGLLGQLGDEVDDLVTRVMGNPLAG